MDQPHRVYLDALLFDNEPVNAVATEIPKEQLCGQDIHWVEKQQTTPSHTDVQVLLLLPYESISKFSFACQVIGVNTHCIICRIMKQHQRNS